MAAGRQLRWCPPAALPCFRDRTLLQDYVSGTTAEYGPIPVEEAEVPDFARRFDPHPFHVDPQAAAAGPFGGLIASGWHSCALMMRLLAREYLSPASSLGSPGIDQFRCLCQCGHVTC